MAKPTDVPAWNTGGANRSEPSDGVKISGAPLNYIPPSGVWNWLFFTIYSWILYLQAGALEGNHSITGNFGVTGTTTLEDDTSVDGDLAVTGDVEADGDLYHGDRQLNFGFDGASVTTGALSFASGFGGAAFKWELTASGNLFRALPMKVGDRIKRITVRGNSSSAGFLTIHKANYDDGGVVPSTNYTSNFNTVGAIGTDIDDPEKIINSEIYFVQVAAGAGDTAELTTIEVVYDRPKTP